MTTTLGSISATEFSGINLACGGKLCRQPGWINADHNPSNSDVMQVNLLNPLPFKDSTFDVVYHSQFIEHLPLEKGYAFLCECHRVLKPGGMLRVVTPDLENQAAEYLLNLQHILRNPGDEATRLRYEWIRLEMLDQLTRNASGGDMVSFLKHSGAKIRNYLCQRMGRSGENLIPVPGISNRPSSIRNTLAAIRRSLLAAFEGVTPNSVRVGKFRLSGESHLCMYDHYLLQTLLAKSGFTDIAKVNARHSMTTNWDLTLLDCDEQGNPDCEVSLFMEAVKPAKP